VRIAPARATRWRSAVALYAGEFLAGDNAEWMYPLRLRCVNAYVTLLERLAEAALGERDHASALEWSVRLVESDRAHEGATRLMMRALAASGRRGARAIRRTRAVSARAPRDRTVDRNRRAARRDHPRRALTQQPLRQPPKSNARASLPAFAAIRRNSACTPPITGPADANSVWEISRAPDSII
jgi:DNA-binding SARP family transcriptional activator